MFICLPYSVCVCIRMSFDACCTCGLLQFDCTPWNNLSLGCFPVKQLYYEYYFNVIPLPLFIERQKPTHHYVFI